jgi:hypothetical protein
MKRLTRAISLAALASMLLLLSSVASAGETSGHILAWHVFAGGGGSIRSTTYAAKATMGQPFVGSKASSSYRVDTGYWAGVPVQHRAYLPVVVRSQ